VTPEALNYLQAPATETTTIEQEIYSGSITGDLGGIGLQSPFAAESIKVALGIESRTERLDSVPDFLSINDELSGTGGPTLPLAGSTKVLDLFTEIRVPLVRTRRSRTSCLLTQPIAIQTMTTWHGDPHDRQYVQGRPGLGTDCRRQAARQLPACDSCAERDRAVHGPGFQSARPAGAIRAARTWLERRQEQTSSGASPTGVPAAFYDADLTNGDQVLPGQAGQYSFLQAASRPAARGVRHTYTFGVILQPRFLPKLACQSTISTSRSTTRCRRSVPTTR
jgi:hypothetical protein